jgi:glycosyltransferase involved in cell wall biosynthesis
LVAEVKGGGGPSGSAWDARVSVIVPCRNAARTLPATLAAVAAQTLRPTEVIGVDDASDDDSGAVGERLGARVLRNEARRNAGGARNRALEVAGGEVLAFLDADAVPSPNWLERVAANLARDRNIVAVGGRIVNGRPGRWGDLDYYLNHSEWIGGTAGPRGTFPTMAVAYRASAVGQTRFPPTNYGEDTFFARTVLRRGGTLWFDPEIVVTHCHERLDRASFWRASQHAGRIWYWTRLHVDRPGRMLLKFPPLLLLFPHLWIVIGRMLRHGLMARVVTLFPWLVAGEIGRIVGFLAARREHRRGATGLA